MSLNNVPDILKHELGEIKVLDGWTKSLSHMPVFTSEHINAYYEKVNHSVCQKSTLVKKHFERGEQLLEEQYIDISSIHVKYSDNLFCIKGVCAASLKKVDRWVTVVINTEPCEIYFAYCQCVAGKPGTCSHVFALLKLIAKWVIEKLKDVPIPAACTSRQCLWSVPQSRDRVIKSPIASLNVVSPEARKRKCKNDNDPESKKIKTRSKGIESTLYDARSIMNRRFNHNNLDQMLLSLETESFAIPALAVMNKNHDSQVQTSFGQMPLGSLLSIHCPLIPSDFKVYCTADTSSNNNFEFNTYPPFPFKESIPQMDKFVEKLSSEKKTFVQQLAINKCDVEDIQQQTIMQADSAEWFEFRKYRLTASVNNKLKSKIPKSDKAFQTLARNLVSPKPTKNKTLLYKLNYGRYHEPIALKKYEQFMRSQSHNVRVENAGLVIDYGNYVLGASPDGKIIDPSESSPYGIIEIKCSEEYKDNDPRDICFISKTSCIELVDGQVRLNKNHSYYDQIQMQLALTTQSWCDFVLYTNKGIVIDRVRYDEQYWLSLREKLLKFYFNFLLDELYQQHTKSSGSVV